MKPIEKYQQKFIELLKEAEEELGGNLKVEVDSVIKRIDSGPHLGTPYITSVKEYTCSIWNFYQEKAK